MQVSLHRDAGAFIATAPTLVVGFLRAGERRRRVPSIRHHSGSPINVSGCFIRRERNLKHLLFFHPRAQPRCCSASLVLLMAGLKFRWCPNRGVQLLGQTETPGLTNATQLVCTAYTAAHYGRALGGPAQTQAQAFIVSIAQVCEPLRYSTNVNLMSASAIIWCSLVWLFIIYGGICYKVPKCLL